jgi:hypothetical protein
MSDAKEKTKGERRYKELAKAKQELVLSLSFNFFFLVHLHAASDTNWAL